MVAIVVVVVVVEDSLSCDGGKGDSGGSGSSCVRVGGCDGGGSRLTLPISHISLAPSPAVSFPHPGPNQPAHLAAFC